VLPQRKEIAPKKTVEGFPNFRNSLIDTEAAAKRKLLQPLNLGHIF
jgi:hypothetical protein